jgi:hypothetical protein
VAGGVNNAIFAMARDRESLYVGGYLSEAGLPEVDSWRLGKLNFGNAGVWHGDQPSRVSVYPNPSSEMVRITSDARPSDVLVLDAFGRSVDCPVLRGEDALELDVRELPSGTYVVRITGSDVNVAASFNIVR